MKEKGKLYDHSGQLISSTDEGNDHNLSPAVQALIETRINSAIDDLRERNRDDLKELTREATKKWRLLALITSAIAITTIFYAPQQIVTWIGNQIDNKLTEPMIRSSADRLIDTKMNKYVTDKLKPLSIEASKLKSNIDLIKENIEEKQSILKINQDKLQVNIHIQELAIASKAGSRSAYSELLRMNENEASKNNLLAASLKEIELFYDTDRGQLSYPVLVKTETMADPGYAVDEAIYFLRTN